MKKKILSVVSMTLAVSFLLLLIGCREEIKENAQVLSLDTVGTDKVSEVEINTNTETSADAIETESECGSDVSDEIDTDAKTDTEIQTGTEEKTETETKKKTEKATETGKKTEMPMTPGETKTEEILTERTYDFSIENNCFRKIGRVKSTSQGMIFDHAASAIEFQGFMTGDVTLIVTSNKESYFTVYVDGVRSETRFMATGIKELTIASFADSCFHTIRVVRQGEVAWSQSMLKSLKIMGYLFEAPEDRDLYIEFYGDSLTSAFGNIGDPSDPAPHDVPKYQDATQSYAFLTTEALNADCSILAMSGVGLATGHYQKHFLYYFSQFCHKRGNAAFEFEGARVPDIAVVRLGANDFSVGCTREQYVSRAKELIDYIRTGYNKDVPIIWMYGSRGGDFNDWLKELSDYYGGEEGGFYLLSLGWRDYGVGAGGHPNVASHEANSASLLAFIEEKKLLKQA